MTAWWSGLDGELKAVGVVLAVFLVLWVYVWLEAWYRGSR